MWYITAQKGRKMVSHWVIHKTIEQNRIEEMFFFTTFYHITQFGQITHLTEHNKGISVPDSIPILTPKHPNLSQQISFIFFCFHSGLMLDTAFFRKLQ
jgi:hypothetical protein